MLINLRNALMAGKQKPTAKDYVQDGLVAMWDGIENAGWGVHDPNAGTWKDLVGGVGDMSIIGSPDWGDDCLKFLGRIYAKNSTTAFANVVLSGTYSIELLIRPEPEGYSNGGIISAGNNSNRIFWIWERSRLYTELIDNFATAQGTWNRPSTTRAHPHALQFSVSPTGATLYIDAQQFQTKATTTTSPLTAGELQFGRIQVNSTGTFVSNTSGCFLRIYSRALTAAEIAANYAIDKARFGLP